MALSIAIKRRMNQKGVGNKELSDMTGIPLRTVNNIIGGITGNPSVDNIRLIAHALDCTIDDLVNDTNANSGYYLDPEAAELANELFERQEMRVLFDASRHVSKEDIEKVVAILESFKKTN